MICLGTLLVNGAPVSRTLFITKEQDKNISYQAIAKATEKQISKLGMAVKISFTHEVIDEKATCIMFGTIPECNFIEVL